MRSPKLILITAILLSILVLLFYPSLIAKFTSPYSGTLLLTLLPSDNGLPLGIYTYGLRNRDLERIDSNYSLFMTPSKSSTANQFAYSALTGNNKPQIHISDESFTDAREVTFSAVGFKRLPVWSPDGRLIAYMGGNITVSDLSNLDNWDVYLTDLQGKERHISSGANPMFSPDGKSLLVLRSDGLYLFNVSGKINGHQVFRLKGGDAKLNMKLKLSKDGKKLAWTSIGESKIYMFTIDSWDSFSMRLDKEIPAHGFWPVFSPDGRYLAFQEVDLASNVPINQRISIIDLGTMEKKTILDLEEFEQTSLFLTEWIE